MTQKKTCLEENFHAIAAILRDLNLHSAIASYGGSGDSGDIYYVAVRYHEEGEPQRTDTLPRVKLSGEVSVLKEGQRVKEIREYELDFLTAMSDLTNAALKASEHDGYEINEGGEGYLTIFADGKAVLNHQDFFDDTEQRAASKETTEFSIEQENKAAALLRIISPVLASAAVVNVEAKYSGYGDDGNGIEIVVTGDDTVLTTPVSVPLVRHFYDSNKMVEFVESDKTLTRTMDLKSAIRDLTDCAIDEAGYRGYQNGDGASGSLVINPDGTATLTHVSNFTSSEVDSYTWNGEQ